MTEWVLFSFPAITVNKVGPVGREKRNVSAEEDDDVEEANMTEKKQNVSKRCVQGGNELAEQCRAFNGKIVDGGEWVSECV